MIRRIRHSRSAQPVIAAMALSLGAVPLSARPDMMTVELCSTDGKIRRLSIPVEQEPGGDMCENPGHACLWRKKGAQG